MVEEGFQEPCVGAEAGIEARVHVVDVDPTVRAGAAPLKRKRKRGLRVDFGKD